MGGPVIGTSWRLSRCQTHEWWLYTWLLYSVQQTNTLRVHTVHKIPSNKIAIYKHQPDNIPKQLLATETNKRASRDQTQSVPVCQHYTWETNTRHQNMWKPSFPSYQSITRYYCLADQKLEVFKWAPRRISKQLSDPWVNPFLISFTEMLKLQCICSDKGRFHEVHGSRL